METARFVRFFSSTDDRARSPPTTPPTRPRRKRIPHPATSLLEGRRGNFGPSPPTPIVGTNARLPKQKADSLGCFPRSGLDGHFGGDLSDRPRDEHLGYSDHPLVWAIRRHPPHASRPLKTVGGCCSSELRGPPIETTPAGLVLTHGLILLLGPDAGTLLHRRIMLALDEPDPVHRWRLRETTPRSGRQTAGTG